MGGWPLNLDALRKSNACQPTGRCGDFGSLDFAHNPDTPEARYSTVHMDTANPLSMFGLGAIIHLVVDIWLGNTQFASTGIPRP